MILLHPSIAMEYIQDASDGSEFSESLVVEAVGLNRWRWEDGDAKMRNPWGVSLIGAYSDRNDVEDLGWGVILCSAFLFG